MTGMTPAPNCGRCPSPDTVGAMAESLLQQQLDEARALLRRARELFGPDPVEPPEGIAADPVD
jgi:hypothetical protein